MKISLIGSFNLAHGYLGAAEALRRSGHDVDFIPAHLYKSEHPKEHVDKILEDLKDQKPELILWWRAETLNPLELRKVRNEIEGKFILYSWDDPFQWEKHMDMSGKCKSLDIAFTCCMDSIKNYESNGCRGVYCPPGFDPSVHYSDFDEEYACDISLVCTNLYHGTYLTKFPHVSRKDLCDWIIDRFPNFDFRIYGVEDLGKLYPKYYRGWLDFEKTRKVFSSSKINLCTHIRPDGDMYINERVCQVLGSGGLLMVDGVRGIEKVLQPNKECVIMDLRSQQTFLEQIKNIVTRYETFEYIKDYGLKKALKDFTWDNWAKTIIENL